MYFTCHGEDVTLAYTETLASSALELNYNTNLLDLWMEKHEPNVSVVRNKLIIFWISQHQERDDSDIILIHGT